jgi:hypothetical protein
MTDSLDTATGLGLDVRPIAGLIGAEIHGVDLSAPLEPAVVACSVRSPRPTRRCPP